MPRYFPLLRTRKKYAAFKAIEAHHYRDFGKFSLHQKFCGVLSEKSILCFRWLDDRCKRIKMRCAVYLILRITWNYVS